MSEHHNSAGFELAGFVGPLKYLDLVGWNFKSITISITMFITFPAILNIVFF
ncbi:hypothetical protein ACFPN4_14590 [Ureibacillus thermophilus]|uniref:hypothetical protein n=1 Tax=Ureibacillus thermophilus TaxID=367743 RepID=UPI00361656F5